MIDELKELLKKEKINAKKRWKEQEESWDDIRDYFNEDAKKRRKGLKRKFKSIKDFFKSKKK